MKLPGYFILASLTAMMSVGIVFAGSLPLDVFSVSAKCDRVTIKWGPAGDGGYSFILVQGFPGGPTYFDDYFEGSGGTIVVPLSPSLDDGDALFVSIERTTGSRYSDTVVVVSCGDDSGETTPVELCMDGRTNTNLCEPLAIYPVESEDGVGMVIYYIPRGTGIGEFMVYLAAEDLEALPEEVNRACTIIASPNGLVVVYLLPSGEIQINGGPDEEGKTFVYRYKNFPQLPITETYFGGALPVLQSCAA